MTDQIDAEKLVWTELVAARKRHPDFTTYHHGYAMIQEEVDELWDAVKRDDFEAARKKAAQVGAMALRFLVDLTPGKE